MDSVRLWKAMKDSGAVWEHPGDPRAPHVVLRSGKHSDGYVDTLQYLSNVRSLAVVAEMLAERLQRRLGIIKVDWVVGSPMAGIPFATALAPCIGASRIGFNEKVRGSDKDLICRFDIPYGQNFLIIEEMTTTGQTPQRGIDAVLDKNPEAIPLGLVGSFLIRCSAFPPFLKTRELVSLISLPELGVRYNEWEKADCPLCAAGSRAIKNCKRVWPNLLRTMRDPTFAIAQPLL